MGDMPESAKVGPQEDLLYVIWTDTERPHIRLTTIYFIWREDVKRTFMSSPPSFVLSPSDFPAGGRPETVEDPDPFINSRPLHFFEPLRLRPPPYPRLQHCACEGSRPIVLMTQLGLNFKYYTRWNFQPSYVACFREVDFGIVSFYDRQISSVRFHHGKILTHKRRGCVDGEVTCLTSSIAPV